MRGLADRFAKAYDYALVYHSKILSKSSPSSLQQDDAPEKTRRNQNHH